MDIGTIVPLRTNQSMIDTFALQFHELKTYNHALKYFSIEKPLKPCNAGGPFAKFSGHT